MAASIRQRWDSDNDRAKIGRISAADSLISFNKAISQEIPEYRAKVVKLPHGQTEVSITPANRSHVIDARMGFNPLLDCARRERAEEEQAERDAENRQRAAKRARQSVRHYTKCIFADHMLTFSYRANVEDRTKVAADWHEFVRLYRIRYPKWSYVAVLEKQDRGAYHLHVAVQGKQDIRWLLRCWLLALGQTPEDVRAWLVEGLKLGDKSLGAVNVEPPKKRWGSSNLQTGWKRDKLAGYLTKYIGKEFEETDKNAKKYWHSRNFVKPEITRFWLNAKTFAGAVVEAHDLVFYTGATSLSMWGDHAAGCIWITGETARERLGKSESVLFADI